MDLFLEHPQQQAERMLRQQQRLMEMQMQGVVAQPPAQNATPAVSLAGGIGRADNYSVQQDCMHRSLRLTSAARVTVAWASACAR